MTIDERLMNPAHAPHLLEEGAASMELARLRGDSPASARDPGVTPIPDDRSADIGLEAGEVSPHRPSVFERVIDRLPGRVRRPSPRARPRNPAGR